MTHVQQTCVVGLLSVVALQVRSMSPAPAWETWPGHHLQNCNFSHFLPWQPRTAAAWPWLWSTKYIACCSRRSGRRRLMFARPWSGRHHIAAPDYDAGDFNLQLIFSKLQSTAAHKNPADNCWSWLASIRPQRHPSAEPRHISCVSGRAWNEGSSEGL